MQILRSVLFTAVVLPVAVPAAAQTLEAFASFPADTFAPGPTSGQFITPANERIPPFIDRQPRHGCGGAIAIKGFFTLSDPFGRIPFPIVADGETYPDSTIPVDPSIRSQRLLTGADFDIEAFREAPDGSARGAVRAAGRAVAAEPVPERRDADPGTQQRLRGQDPDQRRLLIHEFDLRTRRFAPRPWAYRLDAEAATGQAIGDLTAVTNRAFLVIERDSLEGAAATFKKIFLIEIDEIDADGFLVKREVADLLNIADPHRLGGTSATFRFPFTTIESLIPLSRRHLGVLNDNNYPFSAGRTPGEPDPNEFIVVRLDEPLPAAKGSR